MRNLISARLMYAAVLAAAMATLGFAASASAHTGEFAKFDYCPSTNTEVNKCIYSVTNGGRVVLGKKNVPIVNPVILQGGYSKATKATGFNAKFFGATNGQTLSKTPQPVPGGLTGLVNCKEITVHFLRSACEAVFENGVTGVKATLELAKPASDIVLSEAALIGEGGTALQLPVKVHLENPFLGSSCYVGSASTPLLWNLTTGTTAPPPPATPLSGSAGELEFKEEFAILQLNGTELVDNTWSAPHASGCGGFLVEYILDPVIDNQVGLPAAAGTNEAVLQNTIDIALARVVNEH